jgi:thymidylate synthase
MTHSLTFGTYTKASDSWDEIYRDYLSLLLDQGQRFVGRNGETKSTFGASVRVDLRWGFPLTRLRKMPWKNLVREFLFDIGFNTNVEALGPAKHFWDFLADENGELGASAYCRQWRQWPPSATGVEMPNEMLETGRSIDQLKDAIVLLNCHPNSRQATVITHNPTAIDPACPPCHIAMQFAPAGDGSLDLMVPARSNDMVVGFPLDIARYSLMLMVVARAVDMQPRFIYMPSANSHIYENCYEAARKMITRPQRPECAAWLDTEWDGSLKSLTEDHFHLLRYDPHDAIKISVN